MHGFPDSRITIFSVFQRNNGTRSTGSRTYGFVTNETPYNKFNLKAFRIREIELIIRIRVRIVFFPKDHIFFIFFHMKERTTLEIKILFQDVPHKTQASDGCQGFWIQYKNGA